MLAMKRDSPSASELSSGRNSPGFVALSSETFLKTIFSKLTKKYLQVEIGTSVGFGDSGELSALASNLLDSYGLKSSGQKPSRVLTERSVRDEIYDFAEAQEITIQAGRAGISLINSSITAKMHTMISSLVPADFAN
ncbi:hypothetical protein V1517DRAFT_51136 [Lipomyces orientalis]|uniref:Uncharacterized protein n=1 Tax=Lipomyces orientalis TaxID=1233043 RepID=A0ACC3TDW4_9ASCO